MLQRSPYPLPFLGTVDWFFYLCKRPAYLLVNEVLVCLTILTYHEKHYSDVFRRSNFYCFFSPIFCAIFIVISSPLYAFGFICGHIVGQFRCPYLLKESKGKRYNSNGTYSIATANVCLCPEFVSLGNNLPHVTERAKFLGVNLMKQQKLCWRLDERKGCYVKDNPDDSNHKSLSNGVTRAHDQKAFGVSTDFPALDIICFQELLDKAISEIFMSELLKQFPYIIYDVRHDGWKTNKFWMNSGLGIASVHPILEIDFKVFEKRISFCAFTSKGILMCKVLLNEQDNTREVGYVLTAHLQAFQGDEPVIINQLNQVEKCAAEFRERTTRENEVVMFDVICGDFNLDNVSPADAIEASHPIFDKYEDFARVCHGKDHDWTVGTERRQRVIHDPNVQTAEGLAKALQNPQGRQLHLLDATVMRHDLDMMKAMPEYDSKGNMVLIPEGGKRRIDYVLHNREENLSVSAYQFVTQWASTTDHIPVSITLNKS